MCGGGQTGVIGSETNAGVTLKKKARSFQEIVISRDRSGVYSDSGTVCSVSDNVFTLREQEPRAAAEALADRRIEQAEVVQNLPGGHRRRNRRNQGEQ
jgi:hypothetical protein